MLTKNKTKVSIKRNYNCFKMNKKGDDLINQMLQSKLLPPAGAAGRETFRVRVSP